MTGERRERRETRSHLLLVLHSRLRLASRTAGGRTDDSDSRAKNYSFGPSTTWPRHNRVKVASRLFRRGVAFVSARRGTRWKREEKEKNTLDYIVSSGVKVGEKIRTNWLSPDGWDGEFTPLRVARHGATESGACWREKSDWVLILDCERDETYEKQTLATPGWIKR